MIWILKQIVFVKQTKKINIMSWKNAPDYNLSPKERANTMINKIKPILGTYKNKAKSLELAQIFQLGIIKKLENHGLASDYENEVLKEILTKK